MQIYGPAHVHSPQPLNGPRGASSPQGVNPAQHPGSAGDEVQISAAGSFIDQARNLPEIRAEKVQKIRAALADGTYDVEAKLDLTVNRLLDEIG